jgi:type IV pilus biogenesis protein CpaD/CtpE
MEQLPQEFVMMARVSVLLRGCASAFGMRMRTAPSWAEVAHSVLSKEDPER